MPLGAAEGVEVRGVAFQLGAEAVEDSLLTEAEESGEECVGSGEALELCEKFQVPLKIWPMLLGQMLPKRGQVVMVEEPGDASFAEARFREINARQPLIPLFYLGGVCLTSKVMFETLQNELALMKVDPYVWHFVVQKFLPETRRPWRTEPLILEERDLLKLLIANRVFKNTFSEYIPLMWMRHDERIFLRQGRARCSEQARWDRAFTVFGNSLGQFLMEEWGPLFNTLNRNEIMQKIPNGKLDETLARYVVKLFQEELVMEPELEFARPFFVGDSHFDELHAGPFVVKFDEFSRPKLHAEHSPYGFINPYGDRVSGAASSGTSVESNVTEGGGRSDAAFNQQPMFRQYRSSADTSDWEGASDTS